LLVSTNPFETYGIVKLDSSSPIFGVSIKTKICETKPPPCRLPWPKLRNRPKKISTKRVSPGHSGQDRQSQGLSGELELTNDRTAEGKGVVF